jgi:prophage regulatory protein
LPFTPYQFITGRFDDAGSGWLPPSESRPRLWVKWMQTRSGFLGSPRGYWNLWELSFIELLGRNESVRRVSKTQSIANKRSPTPRPTAANECALRLPQVCQMTGLRRSMIYRMQSEKRFPQRIKLTERAVGWLEREVQEWLAELRGFGRFATVSH